MSADHDPFAATDDASSLDQSTSRALIDRARAGCDVSLNELIQSLHGYLLAIARQELNASLRAKVSASDLVQSVLLRAEQNLAEFRGTSQQSLLAWLRKILTNEMIAQHRKYVESEKRDVRREVVFPDDSGFTEPFVDPGRSPHSKASLNEDAWRLRNAIERLPVDYRTVILLRNWEKLTFDEIGTHMQRSVDSVKKLWKRAIRLLEKELRDAQ